MKKLAMVLALVISTNAVIAAEAKVKFTDGQEITFLSLPDNVTRDQLDGYIKGYTKYSPNDVVEINSIPEARKKSNNEIVTGLAMVAVAGGILYALNKSNRRSSSGSCDYEWQTARDGSRCGARAASVRPGGR